MPLGGRKMKLNLFSELTIAPEAAGPAQVATKAFCGGAEDESGRF